MKIVYATDEHFAPIAATSIVSLFEHNDNAFEITVYVLDDGLSEKSRELLSGIAGKHKRTIHFIKIMDIEKALSAKVIVERGASYTTFARLFLPTLLPEADRVLYIDADTLIVDSLRPLWNAKLGENEIIAGVIDCIGEKHKKNIGLSAGDPYINAGIILFDLEKMRRKNTEQLFSAFLKEHSGQKIPFTDQGVINAVLKGKIKTMPLRYNVVTLIYAASYEDMVDMKKADAYVEKWEWESAKGHPAIIHFTTCFLMKRPWVEKTDNLMGKIWKAYFAETGWKPFEFPDSQGKAMKAYSLLYRLLPKRLSAKMTGIVHGTVKARADRTAHI